MPTTCPRCKTTALDDPRQVLCDGCDEAGRHHVCGSCLKYDEEDVETRYSFGIYAGRLCRECARRNFSDGCGLTGGQGDPRDLIEAGETYYEEDY